ncbi:MAG: glycosyltransferase family 9 protein [Phycisphaerales bacterium]
MLTSLKRAWPEASIDWLVQREFADAVRAHPDLSEVVAFDRKAMGAQLRRLNPSSTLRFLSTMRHGGYDLVVDAQGLLRSGIFAYATGARRRIGDRNARELGWLFCNDRVRVDPSLHAVDRMLALLEGAGIETTHDMGLYTPAEAGKSFASRHPELVESEYIVVAPTARWAAKRWAPERHARVCERLLDEGAPRIVVVGGAGEAAQCQPLRDLAERDPRVLNLVGQTSVGELMALIERCALFLGSDSASLHIAVGFARPLVALYGPTRVDLVGPYRRELDVIQHIEPEDILEHKNPRAGQMMERIGVDEVADACLERLRRGHSPIHPVRRADVCGSSA